MNEDGKSLDLDYWRNGIKLKQKTQDKIQAAEACHYMQQSTPKITRGI